MAEGLSLVDGLSDCGLAVVAIAETEGGGVAIAADVPEAGGTFAAVAAAGAVVSTGTVEAVGAAADVAVAGGRVCEVAFAVSPGEVTGGAVPAGVAGLALVVAAAASSGAFTSGALGALTADPGTVTFADVSWLFE